MTPQDFDPFEGYVAVRTVQTPYGEGTAYKKSPPSPTEQRCAEAMARITKYINRACAQHLYVMRGKVRK